MLETCVETTALMNRNVTKSFLAGDVLLVGCGCHFAWAFVTLSNTWFRTYNSLICSFFLGIIIGSAITEIFFNKLPRRTTIFISAITLAVSGCCFLNPSYSYLAGRFLAGFSFSVTYITLMVFIGEVSQNEFKGSNFVHINLSIYFGCIIYYCFTVTSRLDGNYFIGVITIICSLSSIILIYYMKESPYFLMVQDSDIKAMHNLSYYRETSCPINLINTELNEIKKRISYHRKVISMGEIYRDNKETIKMLLVTKFIQMLFFSIPMTVAHLWVIPVLLADFRTGSVTWKLIFLYLCRLIGTIVCMKCLHKSGKINLFMKSLAASTFCLSIIITFIIFNWYFTFNSPILFAPLVVLSIMEYFIGLGIGSVPDVLIGESFPVYLTSIFASSSLIIVAILHTIYYYIVFLPFRKGGDLATFFYYSVYITSLVFLVIALIFMKNSSKNVNENKYSEEESKLLVAA